MTNEPNNTDNANDREPIVTDTINQQLRRAAGRPTGDEPKQDDDKPSGFDGGARAEAPTPRGPNEMIRESFESLRRNRGQLPW